MGDAEVNISASGDVYLSQLLHYDIFKVDNVKNSAFDEIYNFAKPEKFKIHTTDCISKCRDCDFRLLCGGACQAWHFNDNESKTYKKFV